ncbi:ATP-binding protein [Asticcacaulis sp. AND118]|uniref:sensor histidine kinase n=1 Tax=Asticcacaulis sp. AND118 TaxID=2840468 RepID=UPI001CFFB7C8|nr:ATP-binding protein [Asticcacaulis sp. AND118]UDF03201.1 PAS domain-containing protein [Asticcacaulis sp. AND118]
MLWQKLLRQRHYYLVMFVLLSVATVAFSFIVYAHYDRIQEQNRQALFEYEAIRQSRVVLVDLLDMETGVHGYLVSGDEAALRPYRAARDMLERDLSALRTMVLRRDPEGARDLYLWLDNIRALRKTLDDQIDNRRLERGTRLTRETFRRQVEEMAHVRRALETSAIKRLLNIRMNAVHAEKARSDFLYTLVIGNILLIGVMLMGTVTILNLEADFRTRLAEQEAVMQRYREVTEGINDGLFEVNFVSGDFYCSAAYQAMLGYAPDEVENRWEVFRDLIHPDDREAADGDLRRYMEGTDSTYRSTFRMRHKDGGYRWILSRGVGTGADFSGIKSMIGSNADITEQKQREEELRQLYADLETFTYITSHDLRAPLVNLKGFSKELEISMKDVAGAIQPYEAKFKPEHRKVLDLALKEDVPEALGFISKGVERMDSLTRAILDLSRIGKRVYTLEKVDAQAVFDKCVGALGYDITQKGIDIRCDPLPEVYTDPVALEQIFGNLLDNAVKYLRAGVSGRIEMSVRQTLHDYIFTLSDNGRGIADIDKPKVFEIFRRARNTTEVGGLGLGMAYVKATLRRLSGEIWFESKLDEGTRFHVRLPRRPNSRDETRFTESVSA